MHDLTFDSADQIPEALRPHAVAEGGKHVVTLIPAALAGVDPAVAEAQKAESAAWATKASELDSRVQGLTMRSAVQEAAVASSVAPTALSDVLKRAGETFKIAADGSLAAIDGSATTVTEWLSKLKETAPHLFLSSFGGGGGGSAGGSSNSTSARALAEAAAFAKLTPLQKLQIANRAT